MSDSVSTIVTIIGSIVGTLAILAGGLFTFITKTTTGRNFWLWCKDKFERFFSFFRQHRVLVIVTMIAIVVLVGTGITVILSSTKTINGIIYYQQCGTSPARDPVANVTVHLSDHRELKSQPTAPDGSFVIQGIPRAVQPTHLTAQFGGQDFPVVYNPGGDYAIIPRQCEEARDIRELTPSWRVAKGECIGESTQLKYTKRYLLDAYLSGAQGKKEATLTVELLDAIDTAIVNAFVISPSRQFYRNETVPGQDRSKAHTWTFIMPRDGVKVNLELCLGSNQSAAAVSNPRVYTYYELR